ncbi:MAG: LacI family DNA-binding transcriptional regulator [Bacillota bacterium]|nr:LacI family DNA-binding transcriptional regulator [Bacillota bacterium]
MLSKTATIRDVARQAGVSESTVSRVLSEAVTAVSISQETRQRVLAAAEELSYQPHPFARALRGKGANLLGLIVREIDDPFFAQLIEVIGNVAKELGYDLVLGYAKSDPEQALALSEILELRHSDGLFLLGDLKESPEDHTFLVKMGQAHRMLSVCRGSQELAGSTPSIAVDNRKGAFMALSYLAQLGHRRIAHINAGRVGDLRERMEVYCEFMRDQPGESCQEYVQLDENSHEGGYRATRRLLSLARPPTAIFATDDTMAIGALSAAADMGRAVPRDVSVVGFDDVKIAAYLRPALTTVRQPIEIIGRKAVELLVEMIRKETTPDPLPRLLIEPELVVRDSCAPPGAALATGKSVGR